MTSFTTKRGFLLKLYSLQPFLLLLWGTQLIRGEIYHCCLGLFPSHLFLFLHISFTEHCLTSEVPNNWLQPWKKVCFYNQHSLGSKHSSDSNHQVTHEQLPGRDGARAPFPQVNCLLLLQCITALVSLGRTASAIAQGFHSAWKNRRSYKFMPTVDFSSRVLN